jgi:arylsulfatase A-like enzyme
MADDYNYSRHVTFMTREFARTARADERARGELKWIAGESPWVAASVLAVSIACLTDLISLPPWPRPGALALLAGLAVFFGLVHGSLWSLAWVLVGKLPTPLRVMFWPVAGTSAGAWLAYILGSFSRLQTRYWKLATGVLTGCLITGLVFGVVLALYQAPPSRPAWLFRRSVWLRAIAALALCGAAVGTWIVDRKYYPGQYSYAHVALRLFSMWCVMLAIVALARVLWVPALGRVFWAGALGGFLACLLAPNAQRLVPMVASRPWPGIVLAVSQRVTDVDRDGYSAFLGGGDCAPFNPRVHPGAREIPDNGIDDNCLLGDASRRLDDIAELPQPTTPAPIDVVLITVDSMRPDHLGVYNRAFGPQGRGTTPNLDRFAREAAVFDRAYTAGAWTSIAVPSLLRGVYPRRLQWNRWFETTLYALIRKPFDDKLRQGERIMRMFPLGFEDRHPSVATLLRRRGMYTAAVTDDGHSEMLQPTTGIDQGFASFREVDNAPADKHNDQGTTEMAIATLSRVPVGTRFFMWVHYFGIHWPDETHPGIRDYGPEQADHYDHEIAFWDQQWGRLLAAIEARRDPVAVIVAADHGESLYLGIRQHGLTLEEAVIKIPLLVRAPGWPAGHVQTLASSLDIVPTILALTGTPLPAYLDGLDLKQVATGTYNNKPRVLFSDTWRFDAIERLEINYSAAFDGTNKVIMDRINGGVFEFDQRAEMRPPTANDDPAFRTLTRALYGYLEETGGALDLSE